VRGAERGVGVPASDELGGVQGTPPLAKDLGLRVLMTWTFVVLAATLLFTAAVVLLAMYWLESGA
jgi:hypothetical protein